MPTEIAEKLVKDTATLLGKPCSAGIIGLDANRFRDGHIKMLKRERPPFVLVAAGTVEQAQDLEAADEDIPPHPDPRLYVLRCVADLSVSFLGFGAGGHLGSLGSLVLWQLGIIEIEWRLRKV